MKKELRRGVAGGCAAALCLLAALARAADWPAFQYDPQHTAFNENARLRLPFENAWTATLGGEGWGTSSAVLVEDAVYAATIHGEVIAFDRRTGAERWRHAAGGSIYLVPAVSEGRLYFGSAAGALVALEAATGAVLWSYETGSNINASPNVSGGVVYFASNDGYAYALEADTGLLKWRRELGGYLLSSPALDADRVYLGTLSGRFVALNRADGSPAWESNVGSPLRGAPSVSEGLVFIGAADGVLRAFHVDTGAAAWSHATGAAIFDGLAVSSTSVFFASVDGTLKALAKADGASLWSFTAGAGVHAAPSLAGDALVLGTDDGTLYVLGTATGGVRQSLGLTGRIAAPAALGNGQAYVLTDAGSLYALQSPNVAPLAATDLRVNGGTTPVNSQAPIFSWTFRDPDAEDAPSAFRVQVTSTSFEAAVLDSGLVFGSQTSFTAPGTLPEGAYRWRVQTYDYFGASGPYSGGTDSFLIDRTRPVIAIEAPLGGEVFFGEVGGIHIDFTVTDDRDPAPGAEAWLVQSEDRGSPRGAGSARVPVSAGQTLGALALDDGLWTLQVSATDFASNPSTAASGAFEVIHDTLPPRSTLAFGEPNFADAERGLVYVASRTVLTLTSSDDMAQTGDGAGLGVAEQAVLLDGTSYFSFVRPTGSTQTILASTFAVLGEDGVKDLGYGAKDVLGHEETLQLSRVGLDDAAPVLAYAFSREPVVRSSASGAWFPEDFAVVWTATDTGSGLATVSPAGSVTVEGKDIAVAGTATDRLGHEARASVSVNLDKTAPTVSAGSDVEVTEGSSVTFAGTVSDNLDPAPAFAWLFPDGRVTEGEAAPTAFYPDEGGFSVVLVSTDHAGHVASSSMTVRVVNAVPTLEPGGDRLIKEGERLILTVGFTDPGILDTHAASVDWGDGQAATMAVVEAGGAGSASAEHVYGDDGLYLARVTVRDEDGGVSTATVRVIVDNEAPVLAALADQESLEGSTVALLGAVYTDAGLLDTHTATVDWGDGTTEAAATASGTVQGSHVYGDNGTYAVTLTLTDDDGAASTRTFTATVANVAPALAVLADQAGFEGGTFSLQNATFTDAGALDTHTASVDWGDGTTATAAIVNQTVGAQHVYGDNGTHDVVVTVRDDEGAEASRSFKAVVANAAPVLAALADQSGDEGAVFSLHNATFTDPGALDTHTATVDWGDGTSGTGAVTGAAVIAQHVYGDNSTYDVTVTVRDDDGAAVIRAFKAVVTNAAPDLAVLADQTGLEGQAFSLQGATFTDAGSLDTHTATVDWGDGTSGAADVAGKTLTAQHVYGDNGTYDVTVTIRDDEGAASMRSFKAVVTNAAPALAALGGRAAAEGAVLALADAAFTDAGVLDTHSATVDWGDGTSEAAAISSRAVLAQHTYGDNGAYTVVVSVRDDEGALSSGTLKATVANVAPTVAALADQNVAEGSLLSLSGAAFTDPGFLDNHTAIVNWGDGTIQPAVVSSKAVQGQHAYADNGAYTVTVTVADDDGGTSARSFTAAVSNAAPSLAVLTDQNAAEGAPVSLVGASFTDSGSADTHTATVDWGDGTTEVAVVSSKTVQAQHAYGDNGAYAVRVTVMDDDGGTSLRNFTATVSNAAPALAALSDKAAAEGAFVSLQGAAFTDSGFLDTHSATVNWGDGTTEAASISSKTALAQHAYGDDGVYTVIVTVADDDGGTSARSFTASISNAVPILAPLAAQAAVEGALVSLQGAAFTDAGFLDAHSATVAWGDGTAEPATVSSKTVLAQHAYGDNGAFTVTVTVTDDDGGASSRTFTATIANVAPTLTALSNQNAAEGSVVSLQGASFTDPGFLDGHTATVDWGDGTAEAAAISSKTISAQHAYGDNGVYTVAVTVADDDGGTAARTFTATVSNVLPTLAALADRTAAEGSIVSLQGATFTDPGFLDTHSATVNWGDGTSETAVVSSKTVNASHAYGDNGSYAVTVTVTDDDSGISAQGFTATVSNVAPTLAALTAQNAAEGSLVSLQGATFTDPGFLDSHTATVDWGDGTTQAAVITSKTVQALHAYGDDGAYTVTVTVVDDDGGTSSQGFTATVANVAPSLAALTNQTADEGSTISLQGALFTDPGFLDGHTATVDWGDGTTAPATISSQTVFAQHAYGDNGAYTVRVTVADDDGGTSARTFTATVSNVRPALAALADQSASEGSAVALQGASFTDPGFLDSYSATVDWGDGTSEAAAISSRTVLAQHVYGDNGSYAVTVTVADDDGGTAASTFTATVGNVAPGLAALGDQAVVEGALLSLQGAAFTDPGFLDSHTATVDWGDGAVEPAAIASKTVQGQHAYGDNGAYTVTVTVADDDGGTSARSFTATVGNAAPSLAGLADQSAAEGSLVSLQGASFTDPGFLDTHTATVDWGDGSTEAAVVSSKTVQAQHAYGDNGVYTVRVTVVDDDGGTSARSFTASVSNAAPSLAPLAAQAAAEGSLVSLQGAAFTDPGFLDTHSATVDWGDGTAEPAAISSKTVLAQHAYGDNGAFTVTVTVTDDDGGTSVRSFTATVSNAAPALAALANQSADEGVPVSLLGATFTEVGVLDTHTATVDWGDGTSEAATVSSKAVLAQHTYGDNGAYTVTVTVADDDGGASSRTFTATIANVAPSLAALANQTAAEGSVVSLQGAQFTDHGFLDGHTATVDWGDGNSAAAAISSKTISAQHAYGDNGAYTVTVTVADDDGGTAARAFTATVGNVAPTLAALGNRTAAEGSIVTLQGATFTDPGFLDTHSATVNWGDGTSEAAVVSSKTVNASHAYGDNGSYAVTVTVTDDDSGISAQGFTATVSNVAPTLGALSAQNAAEGSFVSLQGATFTDPGFLDSHTATVDWGDGTTQAAVITSKTVQAQHAYGDDGAYTVTVTVADDDGGTASQGFTATVSNVAPSLAALADQTADEGSAISLQGALFTDPGFLDGHTAAVDWGDGTSETATISSKTISAQHAYGDNGAYAVTVTVADDDGGAAARSFAATVNNVRPALAALADRSAAEGSPVILQGAVFTDPGFLDTHSATVDWGDGTSEAATVSSKTVLAQHAYGDNGSYAVTVTVTDDDGGTAASTFTATIANVAPSLAALDDQAVVEGALLSLQGAAFTDPGFLDSHTATVDWGDGSVAAAAITSKTVQGQHAYADNGAYTVTVTVADDDGGTSARSFTAAVSNAAPSLAALADRTAAEGSPVGLQGATFTDPGLADTHTATVDWGDGTTEAAVVSSKAVQAQHAYGDNGAYTVRVTVTDDDGGTSQRTFTATVANVAPALATLSNQAAAEGAFVSLQGAAFTDPGFLDTHSATVDWGDGTTQAADISSKTVLAQHAYGDNGTYSVTVTVVDDDGGTSARSFAASISNAAPGLAPLANQDAVEGSLVSLQGAAFTDPGFLDTHSATVDWGDGTVGAAAVSSKTVLAQHVYGDNGTYSVKVTVVDDDGGISTRAFTARVSNAAPAMASMEGQSALEGSLVSLQGATFTDPGNLDTHTATVDWGDGTVEAASVSSKTVSAQHAYGDNGAFTVTVTVADDDGATSVKTFTATVANVAPSLAALAGQSAAEGSTVSVHGASFSDPGFLDSHTAVVDWGDGTVEAGAVSSKTVSAQHVYGDNGAYTVTVTVTDDDGGAVSRQFTATVANVAPSLSALDDRNVDEGALLSLQGAVFSDPGFGDTHTATVDWGDGSTETAAISSKTVSAQHAYGDNGTYTVTVTVADDDDGLSARSFTTTVANAPPSLAALSDQNAAEGTSVGLQGAVFTDPGFLDSHTGSVNWGDGTTTPAVISSKTLLANHAYGDNGAYTVTVTVADDDGGTSVRTFTATVSNAAPVLAALADQGAVEGSYIALQGATFTDPGFLDSHTAAVNWGDGTSEAAGVSSQTVSARHAYGDNGSYAVTVTVTDDDGGSASRTFTATVGNATPALAAMPDQAVKEGAFIQLPPAAFADVGYLDSHTATVDWGDGTTEPAADIALASTPGGQGTATVGTIQARHAYGDNGSFTVVVTVRDDDGAPSSAAFRVTVANESPALASISDQTAQEGSFIQLPPAAFTDAGYLDTHSATIDWGDGTSEPAADIVLTPTAGREGVATTAAIQARHAYGDNGTYSAVVTVRDDDGAASSSSFRVTVTNAAPAVAALPDTTAVEGAFIQLPPAALTDAGYKDTHSATVAWGDGTSEPAGDIVLTPTPGSEGAAAVGTIQARHAYGDNGVFTAVVTVADDDGAISSSSFKVTVSNALPVLAVLPDVTAAEGAFVQLPPAAFTDTGYLDLHTASIDWGDGTTEPAADIVLMRSAGDEGAATAGTLLARHAYADNGVFTAQVTLRDDDGGSATTPMRVTVTNVAPAVAGMPDVLSGAGGVVQVGGQIPIRTFSAYAYRGAGALTVYTMGPDVVQTFAPAVYSDPGFDNPPGGTHEDFTASVAWGDGQTSTGVGVEEIPGSEGLPTVGRAFGAVHSYAASGVYAVTVSVADDDAGAGARTFQATVDRDPPVTRVGYLGAYLLASAAPAAVPSGLDVFLRSTSEISLFAEDPRVNEVASGVQRVFWREGQHAPFILYTAPFRIQGAGEHIVEYFSVDQRGNEEPHKLLRIGVDDSAPTSAVSYGTAAAHAFGLPLLTPDTPITLGATDTQAAGIAVGVERITYRLDGGPELAFGTPFTVPTQGMHTLEFGSFDRLTNAEVRKTVSFAVGAFQTAALWGTQGVDGSGTADVVGTVLSNATVTLNGSVLLNGDVLAGTVTLKGQAQVLGMVSQGRTPLLAEPVDLNALAQLAAATSSNALIPPDLLVGGALVMGSGRSLTLTTGAYVLKGLRLSGGANLIVAGRVDLLVDGAVEVNGDAGINAAGRSEQLMVFVSSNLPVSFLGGAKFVGTVYAPRAEVQIAGNARAAGSLGGRFVTLTGTGNIATNSRTLPPASSGGGKGSKVASLGEAGFGPAAGADTAFYLRDLYVFPNPAVGGARPTVHVAVGLADKVTIRIYDVSGQDVHQATLDTPPSIIDDGSGPKYAYEYAWNGHIPSGVYLYTIVAEKSGQPAVRKAGKFAVVR